MMNVKITHITVIIPVITHMVDITAPVMMDTD